MRRRTDTDTLRSAGSAAKLSACTRAFDCRLSDWVFVHVMQEGRAGRLIPKHWKADVNYAFGAHDTVFKAGEEVVLRRGDGSLRFARVEALYQDEVVLVLGPNPNIKTGGNKDKVAAVPFRLVKRSEAGKLLLDDWVPDDQMPPSDAEDTVCVCVCVCVCVVAYARARWLSISLICCPFRKLTTMSASMLILLIAFLFALLPLAHTQTCRARRHDGGKRCGGIRMPTPRHLPPTTLRGPRKTLQNCLGSKVWPSHGKVSLMRVRIACRSALPALQHCLPFTH
jgi:hypothetical protein